MTVTHRPLAANGSSRSSPAALPRFTCRDPAVAEWGNGFDEKDIVWNINFTRALLSEATYSAKGR